MLKVAGDVGFVTATLGVVVFTALFFSSVRWWTDWLGRAIAAVFGSIFFIMVLAAVRIIGFPLPGLFWWRAFLFNALGLAIWGGVAGFVWAQFFAPRLKNPDRMKQRAGPTRRIPGGLMNRTKAPAIFMGIAFVIMAGLTVVRDAMADQHVSAEEWILVSIALAGAVQVWGAANIPGFAKAKTLFAVLTGVLALLVTLISGGLTMDEIILLILEAGGILGVVAGPQPSPSAALPAGQGTAYRQP